MVEAAFEIFLFYVSEMSFLILQYKDRNTLAKYLITLIGIFLFTNLTQGLFVTENLEKWAFLYGGVSWILILYWASLILISLAFVNYNLPGMEENKRFFLQILFASAAAIISEAMFFGMGVRSLNPHINESLSGSILFGQLPIEILFYVPMFMLFVIAFKRYWEINYFIS